MKKFMACTMAIASLAVSYSSSAQVSTAKKAVFFANCSALVHAMPYDETYETVTYEVLFTSRVSSASLLADSGGQPLSIAKARSAINNLVASVCEEGIPHDGGVTRCRGIIVRDGLLSSSPDVPLFVEPIIVPCG